MSWFVEYRTIICGVIGSAVARRDGLPKGPSDLIGRTVLPRSDRFLLSWAERRTRSCFTFLRQLSLTVICCFNDVDSLFPTAMVEISFALIVRAFFEPSNSSCSAILKLNPHSAHKPAAISRAVASPTALILRKTRIRLLARDCGGFRV